LPRWAPKRARWFLEWPTSGERERERERKRIEKNRWGDAGQTVLKRAERRRNGKERASEGERAGNGAARMRGGGGRIRIKIQISQPGKSPHFEVRGAQ